MKTLLASLRDSDAALLPIFAKRWGVSITNLSIPEQVNALNDAMLNEANIERVWESLSDDERGALQTLAGSSGGKMTLFFSERVLGKIRRMGPGQIEREKPHERPSSFGEALFYRGLIYEAFEQSPTGAKPVVYVPSDLLRLLPTHKTGYGNLADLPPETLPTGDSPAGDDYDDEAPTIDELDAADVTNIRQADTTIVDDMTTLLAYLQTQGAAVEAEMVGEAVVGRVELAEADRKALLPHLLMKDEIRLAFLLAVGISVELIDVQSGRAYPRRAEARRWLEGKRAAQIKTLAEAWRDSTLFRDLWYVPGLHPEPTGWPYDPVVARAAMLQFLRDDVPRSAWWSLDEFIMNVKELEPDFQRPGGDYDSWYIRNDAKEYLNGFESWDAVEGALLEFYLLGPLHWLGLVDLGDEAARLTAYGRAFMGAETWPAPPETEDKIALQPDGTMLVSRRVSRIDRFQLARFTAWTPVAAANAPYSYRLTPQSVRHAGEQSITPAHIAAFVKRALPEDAALPPNITKLLELPQTGATSTVSLERLLVLRTTARETLDFIFETPALRRYLGARLGEMAVIVRADQWEALRDALAERNIDMDVMTS